MPEFDAYSGWLSPTNMGNEYFGDDSTPQYSTDYDRFSSAGDLWGDAASYGYSGNTPGTGEGDQQAGDPKKELMDWMKTSGYNYRLNPTFNGGQQNAWFQGNKLVPGSYKEFEGGDPMFGIASSMLGAAGGQFVGGLAGLGSLGSGALAGGMRAGMQDPTLSSITKGAASGGLASYTPNIAGMTGMQPGTLGDIINGAAKGGVQSAINGGNIGRGAVGGGTMAGISSLGDNMDFYDLPGSGTAYDASGESTATLGGNYGSYGTTPAMERAQEPQAEGNFWETNPLGKFMTENLGSRQQIGDLAQGVLGIYSGLRRQRAAKEMMRSVGANRESYLSQMRSNLGARDAAAGRRSNIGGREVELQAKLAELDSRNAPAFASLSDARMGGLEQMMASGLRYGNKQGWFGSPDTGGGTGPVGPGMSMPGYSPPSMNSAFDYSLDPARRQRLGGY